MDALKFYHVWYILDDGSEIKCWVYTSLDSAHRCPADGVKRSKGVVGYRVKMEEVGRGFI